MNQLLDLIHHFEGSVDQLLSQSWSDDPMKASGICATGITNLVPAVIEIGALGQQMISEGPGNGKIDYTGYVAIFEWLPVVKDALMLLRDSALQHFKAEVHLLDGQATEIDLTALSEASLAKIQSAFMEVKGLIQRRSATLANSDGSNRQMRRWQLQRSPWAVYQEQFEKLSEQGIYLQDLRKGIVAKHRALENIRDLILETADSSRSLVGEYQITAQETIDFIEGMGEVLPKKIASHLGDIVETLPLKDQKITFTNSLQELLAQLSGELNVPYIARNGSVVVKTIDLSRNIRVWLESEILPLLYELWGLQNNLGTATKISAVNIRNRALVLANSESKLEAGRDASHEFTMPFKNFLTSSEDRLKEIKGIQRTLRRRLDKRFWLSKIFDENTLFLTSPFQRGLRPFTMPQNKWIDNARSWFGSQFKQIRNIQNILAREDLLSEQEKIVRFIQSRAVNNADSNYLSLFKTRDYVGESFCVGRSKELDHIAEIISNWKNGFAGSIILSGQRLAGKSLLGEMIVHRHFPRATVRPKPQRMISWQGRAFTPTTDMEALLNFIEKHPPEKPFLLWLDDFELWSDNEFFLSQNLQSLLHFLNSPISAQVLVMVSMSNWLLNHFDFTHQIRKAFHTEINLDQMSLTEVQHAIAIRHGATHRILVDQNGKEVTPAEFSKITARVYRWSKGNIGEALNRWSALIHSVDEERVSFTYPTEVSLPKFIDADTAIILSTIMLYKRINEYRLRKLFGPKFNEGYRSILQRLLNLRVLIRDPQGQLMVNEILANTIGRYLAEDKYLQFNVPQIQP